MTVEKGTVVYLCPDKGMMLTDGNRYVLGSIFVEGDRDSIKHWREVKFDVKLLT